MAEWQLVIPRTIPLRAFESEESRWPKQFAVFPDGRRIVTRSGITLLLWDLKDGIIVKEMEGNSGKVETMAVSRDGQFIAGGGNGELCAWDGDTGECLIAQVIKTDCKTLDFSPDGAFLASGSSDCTTKLWNTETWQLQGNPIDCGHGVNCVRYSPDGELLAIATSKDIQIWNPSMSSECITNFKGHAAFDSAWNLSLVWTPDGTRLLSVGSDKDHIILEWDSSTWKQVGDPWIGHTGRINGIVVNSAGTLVASASDDRYVHLWRLSDRQVIASFRPSHFYSVGPVTFSTDGKRILSGDMSGKTCEWAVPEDALPDSKILANMTTRYARITGGLPQILAINVTACNACIDGDLHNAEELLTQEIDADDNNYISYANRSFVMARKPDWDCALHDALKSVSIQPSLTGYISMGIALCGKRHFQDAMQAFDLAFMFTDRNSKTIHLLLLIKAIALFNVNKPDDAILRVQQLAAACPKADILGCRIVEVYLRFQINGLDSARPNEATDHFTSAVNAIAGSSLFNICSHYELFVVLFGWDLKSLWKIANQKRCHAFLRAGRLGEAIKSYRNMMDMSDEIMKASCLDWSTAFKRDCSALYAADGVADLAASGDAALAESDYDRAIELYSVAIDLDSASDTIFSNRSRAKLEKGLWEDALVDAQKVVELNPSSYIGYKLKHAALNGAQRYDEAIQAHQIMLSKLEDDPDTQIQKLREKYVSALEVEGAVRKFFEAQMENAPPRLLNTYSGRLCDREAQINDFKTSTKYRELLSSTVTHVDLQMGRIQDVVMTYFCWAMLSHRWEGKEPLLHDIQDKVVYDLNPGGGFAKLQSFCKVARDAGYRWAWMDTCCIDQSNNVELQESVNSMFVWYRHSALTIVYLSDVPPSSKPGALAQSAWNSRGWTVQEFLAPNIVLFYQKNWTPYLDDCSQNHKDSVAIMQELGDATGIDARALVAFHPGMNGAREKLQWVSTRVTTLQEDIAYSLFGIFGVHLPVIYGEKKHNALGRLLQEVIAQSGDISALDWIGKSSEFNSCLPADITSYEDPPCKLPSMLSADEMQISVSSLRHAGAVELASKLYSTLDSLSAPRFAYRRLHLPCIAFPVTQARRQPRQGQETYTTYEVKADGLRDLLITTEDKLVQFSQARPIPQTFLLVLPWNRSLLELPDFAELPDSAEPSHSPDESQSMEDYLPPLESPLHDSPMSSAEKGTDDSESHSRALRLIARLGQPFGAFLLAQQRGGEYKRIASDHDIIAQAKDVAAVNGMMDVRTFEIL